MIDVKLKEISHDNLPNEKVMDWDFVHLNQNETRIYYKPNGDDGNGFYFYTVSWFGSTAKDIEGDNMWDGEHTFVECLFTGLAYFDGVRHLYFGHEVTENYGYLYYPHVKEIALALLYLEELERKHCRDVK